MLSEVLETYVASQQNYHHQSSMKVVKFDAEIKSKLCQRTDSWPNNASYS